MDILKETRKLVDISLYFKEKIKAGAINSRFGTFYIYEAG